MCMHTRQALHLPVARRLNDAASRVAGRIAQQQAEAARASLQHDIRLLEQSITWESTQLHTIGDAISQLALDDGARATARQHIAQLLDDCSSTAGVGSTPLLVQAARCVHASCACLKFTAICSLRFMFTMSVILLLCVLHARMGTPVKLPSVLHEALQGLDADVGDGNNFMLEAARQRLENLRVLYTQQCETFRFQVHEKQTWLRHEENLAENRAREAKEQARHREACEEKHQRWAERQQQRVMEKLEQKAIAAGACVFFALRAVFVLIVCALQRKNYRK